MVDHICIEGDEVKVVTVNADGDFVGPVGDADTARIFLAMTPIDEVLPKLRHGDRLFLTSVMATATAIEMAAVAKVWTAIREELTDDQHDALVDALASGVDRQIADLIFLKFSRSYNHPGLVRGDIASVSGRVDSLAGKAAQIAKEVGKLSKALEHEQAEGINATAFEANLVVDDVLDGIAHLQGVLADLAKKRDTVISLGRRANAIRRRFAREWFALWREVGLWSDGEDRQAIENALAGAVEAVEGVVGRGQREWVTSLVDSALAPTDADET